MEEEEEEQEEEEESRSERWGRGSRKELLGAKLEEDDVLVAAARRAVHGDHVLVARVLRDRNLALDPLQVHLFERDTLGGDVPARGHRRGARPSGARHARAAATPRTARA